MYNAQFTIHNAQCTMRNAQLWDLMPLGICNAQFIMLNLVRR